MFDLDGSLANYPGLNEMQKNITPCHKVQKLEEALAREVNDSRFVPYLQLHEKEENSPLTHPCFFLGK